MKNTWIRFFTVIFLFFFQYFSVASANPVNKTLLKATFSDNELIITNMSPQALNLRHASIQFHYFGKIFSITNANDKTQPINFAAEVSRENSSDTIYTTKLYGTKHVILLPNKTLKLALVTDKKDVPHDLNILTAPTPIDVTVTSSNANWVQTISVCNTTANSIPLKNIEISFNFSQTMPTNIWGSPWASWKVGSQVGNQVVLIGGTEFTPPLPADPQCMNPLTIQFNNPPTSSQPLGPFVFKAEVGGDPQPTTGNLNVNLAAAPAAGLPNPLLTVTGPGTNQQQMVTWGTTWPLTGLSAGTYTVSGATIGMGGQTYTADTKTATVVANGTATVAMSYKAGAVVTTPVTINLVNAPSGTVPITLSGPSGTINQTVANGAVINLANGTYSVSSNVAGYNATPTPNPLVVPTNTMLSISYTAIPVGDAGSRTINFVNQCSFPVWFGFISGATPSKNGTACVTDADCHPGSVCVDRGAAPKHCFWKNPIPANNNFQLAPNGGTNSVFLPYVKTPMNAVFSGAAAGRTNCTAAGCETADCGGGTGGCPPGKGFSQPTTQIEFTFQTNASDFYNLSAVDGMNIPSSMAPTNAPFNSQKPYDCGTPGNAVATPLTGACTWDFNPPIPEYRWVRAGGAACTSNADCTGGTVCGLSKNAGTPRLRKTCGKLLGWFNANRICAEQNTYGAPFNCQEQLPAPNQAYKMTNMLGCAPIPSCYKTGAGTDCCGCANWDKLGIGVPPAPYTEQCGNMNPFWVNRIQPGLEWIKRACPSIYTYAFDDMSSTFVCRVNKDNGGVPINSTNYTITFCPGGKTGGITP